MSYLSPHIEVMIKRKQTRSLVKPTHSCGIFQDYGDDVPSAEVVEEGRSS